MKGSAMVLERYTWQNLLQLSWRPVPGFLRIVKNGMSTALVHPLYSSQCSTAPSWNIPIGWLGTCFTLTVIVDFIYVDSPCFAHVLSNTRLETTNFEPCSFKFCKFWNFLIQQSLILHKTIHWWFYKCRSLYYYLNAWWEDPYTFLWPRWLKDHRAVAKNTPSPTVFCYGLWRVQDGCTTVPPYWAILLIFQNSSIHHLGCKKRKLSDVSMVGYSLLSLAVSCSINFRVWNKCSPEIWRRKMMDMKGKSLFMGRSVKLRGCTPLKSNIDTQNGHILKESTILQTIILGYCGIVFGIYVSFSGLYRCTWYFSILGSTAEKLSPLALCRLELPGTKSVQRGVCFKARFAIEKKWKESTSLVKARS